MVRWVLRAPCFRWQAFVLDRNVNPVTGLTAGAFTLLENGVKHRIDQFSIQSSAGMAPAGRVFAVAGARTSQ